MSNKYTCNLLVNLKKKQFSSPSQFLLSNRMLLWSDRYYSNKALGPRFKYRSFVRELHVDGIGMCGFGFKVLELIPPLNCDLIFSQN